MEHYTTKELGLLLQSISSRIDQFIEDSQRRHTEMNETLKEHNGRLRKSEKTVFGVKVMISTGVGIFVVIILPVMVWYASTVSASIEQLDSKIERIHEWV